MAQIDGEIRQTERLIIHLFGGTQLCRPGSKESSTILNTVEELNQKLRQLRLTRSGERKKSFPRRRE